MLFDRERIHWAERIELRTNAFRLGTQGRIVQLHRDRAGEEFVERPAPLDLETFANRRATGRQLGQAELGLVQLVGERRRAMTLAVEPSLGTGECFVRRPHGVLSH